MSMAAHTREQVLDALRARGGGDTWQRDPAPLTDTQLQRVADHAWARILADGRGLLSGGNHVPVAVARDGAVTVGEVQPGGNELALDGELERTDAPCDAHALLVVYQPGIGVLQLMRTGPGSGPLAFSVPEHYGPDGPWVNVLSPGSPYAP